MSKVPFVFQRLATVAYLNFPIILSGLLPSLIVMRFGAVCVGLLGKKVALNRGISTAFLNAVLASVVLSLGSTNALAQKVTGAIFTTDENGQFVNANVYDSMEKVYLNGGPRPNQPCGAPGLPDGDYYFQVTDPSGKVLLTIDDIEDRKVKVSNGMIAKYYGTRTQSIGTCGDVIVALYPYDPTTNNGGEYKVWMTPVESYDHTQSLGSHGFIPSKSKTDNFKVWSADPDTEDPGGCPDENSEECDPGDDIVVS